MILWRSSFLRIKMADGSLTCDHCFGSLFAVYCTEKGGGGGVGNISSISQSIVVMLAREVDDFCVR